MTDQEIIKTFQDVGALLDGHFVLRSKLHSNKFFQAALLFKYPDIAEKLCQTLAERMKGLGAETVISPAVGGILVGQELARALKIGTVDFGIPLFSLIKLNLPTYQPEECPLCKQGIPVVRPGSKS